MRKLKVYVVTCAFNEQPRLPGVLKRLAKYFSPSQVVVVDDGSYKPLMLKSKSAGWLLRHEINLGKGAAMKTGADFAFSKGADAVIFMDADGQHDPRELSLFIDNLHLGYDLLLGVRTYSTSTPAVRFLGNRLASLYLRLAFMVKITDVLCGFRAMTHRAYKILRWESSHYGVETEMVARLGLNKHRLRWTSVPVSTIYKDKYKGVTLVQAVKILGESIWWKLS